MKKIHILYLIDKLTPAGTQLNLLEIMKRLDRSCFEPHLIALVEGGELEEEFRVIGIEPVVLRVGKVYGPSGWRALLFLIRYLKEKEIDIVQTHFLHADILGTIAARRVRGVKIVSARRDEGFWRTRRQLAVNRFFSRRATCFLANSSAVRSMVRQSEQVSSRQIEVIHNGVDLDKFFPSPDLRAAIRCEFGIQEDEYLIGMVANMRHRVKGHRYLIKAISHLKKDIPNVKLLLVGDGPLRSDLEGYAVRHKVMDRTLFVGVQRDVSALLNAMDVVCVPSLSEGFSNTILEAMAVGKPVVATHVGGNPEAILDGETGFLVRPRDERMISEKLLLLFKNRSFREEMGRAARRHVQSEFRMEKMIHEYESFYTKLSTEPRRVWRRSKKHHVLKTEEKAEQSPAALGPPSFDTLFELHGFHRFRVLYLIWSLDLGGAERVAVDLAKGLNNRMFKPKVCCLNDKGRYASLLERRGIRVFALRKRPKFDLSLIPRLVRLIKEERIDLIHSHLFGANLWGRIAAHLAGIPIVCTEHGMDAWRTPFHLTLDRLLAPISKRVVFVSQAVKKFYQSKHISLNGKSRVIYNGIDLTHFGKSSDLSSIRLGLGLAGTQKVIGIVGRLVPEKAHDDFIRAIQLLAQKRDDVVGLIVGHGELLEPLAKQVKDAGLERHVIFTGHRDDLAQLYQAMDVFVLCSEREGFPLVALEAMASQVPVVATAVGGIGELLKDHETGLLVPPRNPEALAGAISTVLENGDLREKLVNNAYQEVRTYFGTEQMVQNYESLYQEVLASC